MNDPDARRASKAAPPCPRCSSADTEPLRNFGRPVAGRFQCLACWRWFGPDNPPDAGGTGEPAPYYDPATKRCPHGTRAPHQCRDGCEDGPVPAACDPMGPSRREDLDAAAREIDALIGAGDVAAMQHWAAANDGRMRWGDAYRLATAMRAAEKGAHT